MQQRAIVLLVLALAGVGCSRKETQPAPRAATVDVDTLLAVDASAPAVDVYSYDPAALEAARGDSAWLQAARVEVLERTPGSGRPLPVDTAQTVAPGLTTRASTDTLPELTLQVWLDRVHFSPGVIDGRTGKNTAKAVYWFQEAYGLRPTGSVDPETRRLLERLAGRSFPPAKFFIARRRSSAASATSQLSRLWARGFTRRRRCWSR